MNFLKKTGAIIKLFFRIFKWSFFIAIISLIIFAFLYFRADALESSYIQGEATWTNGTLSGLDFSTNTDWFELDDYTEAFDGGTSPCEGYADTFPDTAGGDIIGCFPSSGISLQAIQGSSFPNTDGVYWFAINNVTLDKSLVFCTERIGGVWQGEIDCGIVPPDTTTRIIDAYYATSTQNYIIEAYLDPSRAFPTIEWVLQHPLIGQTSAETIIATTTGAVTYEIPVLVDTFATSTDGWFYEATTEILSYETCTGDPWFGTEVLVCSDPLEPLLSATTTRFFINSTDEEIDLWDSYQRANLIATTTCGIASIDGCFRNAFIWAFVPDEKTFEDFQNFKDKLTTKAPVGYFFQTTNSLKNISSESENEFTYEIPTEISTNLFSPIRLLLASVLWIFFIVHIYKRLKRLEL